MTVAVTPRYQNHNGNGTTGPFSFTFPILLSDTGTPYIKVTEISAAGVETVLAYPADYTFSPVQLGKGGGIITTTNAVANDGSRLFIEAETPLNQGVGYSNQGDFYPETHEKSYDKLHYIVQEASRKNSTAIRIPTTDVTGTTITLPSSSARANTTLGFDAAGNVICGSVSTAIITTPMIPVVQAASIVAARAELGLGSAAVEDSPAFDAAGSAAAAQAAAIASAVSTSVQKTGGSMSGNLNVPSLNGGQFSGLRNKIINGNFDIWQRGTSFTIGTGTYCADRWRGYSSSNFTLSRSAFTLGQTDVPYEPSYYATLGAGAAVKSLSQRIEGARSLAGQSATLSFYAKADSATSFSVALNQYFGSSGSAAVSNQGDQTINLTTAWQKFTLNFSVPSVTGKTISGGDDYLEVMFGAVTAIAAARIVDIAQCQLEAGSVASPFELRNDAIEQALCERYFEKTFPIGTAPASAASSLGAIPCPLTNATGFFGSPWSFKTLKRATPTITLYNPLGGTAGQWRNVGNTGSSAALVALLSDRSAMIYTNNGSPFGGTSDIYVIHATASAEL